MLADPRLSGGEVQPKSWKMEGMAEYKHSAHTTFDLEYYIIWITKSRDKII